MAKQLTNEDVQKAEEKAAGKATKAATKSAAAQVAAEMDRVKQSDLGKTEKKAALAHLKNVAAAIKSPIGA